MRTKFTGLVPISPARASLVTKSSLTKLSNDNTWNAKVSKGVDGLNTMSVVIDLTDAALTINLRKAAEVAGMASSFYVGERFVARLLGAKAVPFVGQILGLCFSLKDIRTASKKGDKFRLVISGIEASLYGIATLGSLVSITHCWNPVGWGVAPISAVIGGTAVTLTISKSIYDNWNTVKGWFQNHHHRPMPKVPSKPSSFIPFSRTMTKPRQTFHYSNLCSQAAQTEPTQSHSRSSQNFFSHNKLSIRGKNRRRPHPTSRSTPPSLVRNIQNRHSLSIFPA